VGGCQGARVGDTRNPGHAAALGHALQSIEADRFAANVLPIVETIKAQESPASPASLGPLTLAACDQPVVRAMARVDSGEPTGTGQLQQLPF
jgi:hypothetical protein